MAIHVALHHRTHYTYDRLVGHAPHLVRLRPAPHCRTRVLSYSLRIAPATHFIHWQQDPHANYLARLTFPEPSRELLVEVDLVAEMAVHNPFDFFLEPEAECYPFAYEPWLRHELAPFLTLSEGGERFEALVERVRPSHVRTVDFVVDLNRQLQHAVRYLIRLEPGVQSPEETLTLGSGSCRDSAWLLVHLLRRLGVAARFVSGYLIQLAPDVKSLDGPSGPERDFTDLHAWAEAYLPGAGWIGLDPTSGLLAGEGHLPLACTPDPGGAAPVTGAVDPCESKLDHHLAVRRIFESPRVTLPYTDRQWAAIQSLGHRVDQDLVAQDVRLTMGGEPTFVSIDDMDGAEWTTAALGPAKRQIADDLLRRLQRAYAPGGLLFHGQGKWYPGESLPRWALSCHWRRDGIPLWQNPGLIADESRHYGHGPEDARRFALELARRLDVNARHLLPGYEDTWYYLWKERRLPVNVDPLKSQLRDPEERARLARVFEQGLERVVGYALPLERAPSGADRVWRSGPWFLRPETLFLIPGDSPMGFRLPLESLPWVAPGDFPWSFDPDPHQVLPPLPPGRVQRYLAAAATLADHRPPRDSHCPPAARGTGRREPADPGPGPTPPAPGESAPGIVRSAVCVEPRHGRLHVFLPPVSCTEDYLELVDAVEATADTLGLPVILEGTPPPQDHRLSSFKVTPDPGVIEVNLQPAHHWEELVRHTQTLYEEARNARLGTEKFLLDGRHTGTGGGNHILIGGATPSDSPILRRPDLLRSLVGYWHNHPALSYLFSSLFIGPTSQHPRVDEARNDSLYELEIAFREVPERSPTAPWLVDRVFRHLLIDATGNTHRAEFCIDKLYAPEGPSGRLGLVELRAFEMPPHARMSLVQHLLLRALIAWFWRHPYARPLVRWGTDLHDRFLLPHFVRQDLDDVLHDLRGAGYALESDWFAPHFEFRFPRVGECNHRGVALEFRTALEPWHVLGEEAGPGGTVRFVDSSVERLQVRARGLVTPRHRVTCNGQTIPLHPTGTVGEFVAGVRFRAWQPPSCLHPTLGVHAPLVFDLVDTWNERSVGGCTYHVMHPGGRNYTHFPVNAFEAESRRLARFIPGGHTPGPLHTAPPVVSAEFPLTLDLRRPGGRG